MQYWKHGASRKLRSSIKVLLLKSALDEDFFFLVLQISYLSLRSTRKKLSLAKNLIIWVQFSNIHFPVLASKNICYFISRFKALICLKLVHNRIYRWPPKQSTTFKLNTHINFLKTLEHFIVLIMSINVSFTLKWYVFC